MKPQEIKEVLKSLRKTDIEEIRYESGGNALYFKRSAVTRLADPEIVVDPPAEPQTPDQPTEEKTPIIAVKSTVVGTFFYVGKDDTIPISSKGAKVKVGQKIGQVEAMKISKDVLSTVDGEIVEILVANGAPVEYGQDLVLVDTGK
ncbi:MAG: hypothetical protein LBB93_05110 [Elusimicrobiota bacterium]|jgi:biotin carboxyl carrier protein|nr:hypothetical protein [Elusimicrobiota bacterium]